VLFSQAAALDPGNPVYAKRSAFLKSLMAPQATAAAEPPEEPEAPDPAFAAVTGSITPMEMEETRRLLPPPQLDLPPGEKSFDLRGDSKSVLQQIAQTCGLTIVWELDYQPTASFRFQLASSDCRAALRAAERATDSFVVPFSSHTILVARDTPQKRTELEPVVAKAIPIPERSTIQEVQEVIVAIQQSLQIRRIIVDPQKRLIFLLDRVFKARVAERLLAEMVRYRPQVAIELDYLTVDKSKSLTWGATLQNSFPLVNFANVLNSAPSIPAGFTHFITFGGGQTLFGIGIANAATFATVTKSVATTSQKARVTALDGEETNLHIGQKYPIMTNGYFGDTGETGQVYTPPPTFSFEDLGLVLKVKPSIHSRDEVTLTVDAEFKALGAGSANGIPIINDRKYQGTVRLKTGEWAVVTGLMSTTASRNYSGFPLLDRIPVLRDLFGDNTRNTQSSDVLLVIKPHILSVPPVEQLTRAIWVGSEAQFRDLL
jgi:type II secretory pathway component GspD/PulD (secretin)